MAKFINTRKAVSEIESLIRNAGDRLILVSPYLKLAKDFKEWLTYRNGKDKTTTVIFRDQKLHPDELKFLQGLHSVVLKCHNGVHAKCYVNDDKMIITSLNLYDFSMENNKEMGVLIDKNDPADTQLFHDAFKEVEYINETSIEFKSNAPKSTFTKQAPSNKPMAYCIRTGVKIPFDFYMPLCDEAFKTWVEYGDEDYPENYCHFSGERSYGETSVGHPILGKNWKKAKEIFDL